MAKMTQAISECLGSGVEGGLIGDMGGSSESTGGGAPPAMASDESDSVDDSTD
jgi:hypothetical protein